MIPDVVPLRQDIHSAALALTGYGRMARRMLARDACDVIGPDGAVPLTNPFLACDPPHLGLMLRGLADIETVRGGIARSAIVAALIGQSMPEAHILLKLHRQYRARRTRHPVVAAGVAVAALHAACHHARRVRFRYVDLRDRVSYRTVRPLEIVQAGDRLMLLAWCETRAAQRKFFLHAITAPVVRHTGFAAFRLSHLQEALDEADRYRI